MRILLRILQWLGLVPSDPIAKIPFKVWKVQKDPEWKQKIVLTAPVGEDNVVTITDTLFGKEAAFWETSREVTVCLNGAQRDHWTFPTNDWERSAQLPSWLNRLLARAWARFEMAQASVS